MGNTSRTTLRFSVLLLRDTEVFLADSKQFDELDSFSLKWVNLPFLNGLFIMEMAYTILIDSSLPSVLELGFLSLNSISQYTFHPGQSSRQEEELRMMKLSFEFLHCFRLEVCLWLQFGDGDRGGERSRPVCVQFLLITFAL